MVSPPTYKNIEITPELLKLKEKAKREESLSGATSQQIEDLLCILNQEKKTLAKNKLFKEALKCTSMINYVSQFLSAAKKRENQKVAKKEFTIVHQQFEDSFNDFDEETKLLEKELIAKQKKRLEELQNTHQAELNDLEARWNSEKKQRIYNKCTSDLHSMRKRITFLLVDNRFEEAEGAQQDADERTEIEVFDHHYLMQRDYDKSLKNLVKKQFLEMETFKTDCIIEQEKLKQDRLKLRQGFVNRQLKLKTKKDIIDDPDKLWAHRQTERFVSAGKSNKSSTLSPSSRMKVSDFRELDNETLALPPLENHLQVIVRTQKFIKKD